MKSRKPPGNWSGYEDRKLTLMIRQGEKPEAIADRLNRMTESVLARARILGLMKE